MASKRPQQTRADYAIIPISFGLITALVCSLVFFLIEVLYQGNYEGRLTWTFFWFVLGAVAIASGRAQGLASWPLLALGLGIAVFLALNAFVKYEGPLAAVAWGINLALMALVWWCADRLTRDCTVVDETVDATGQGLLEAAGLETTPEPEAEIPGNGEPEKLANGEADEESSLRRRVRASPRPGFLGWLDRYSRYREEKRKKPSNPGTWVVYFSLAALPLFGLGQSLIPPSNAESRRYTFWLMGIYVASGLGLLLTTSFLGLRRYLRQRKLQMPLAMTGVWLTVGCMLILGLLIVGALLPRPSAEYSLLKTVIQSPDREASRYAVKRDAAGKGEGRASTDPQQKDDDAKPGSGTQSGDQGEKRQSSDQRSQESQGQGESKGSGDKQGEKGQSGDESSKGKSSGEQAKDQEEQKASSNGSESSSQSESQPLKNLMDHAANITSPLATIFKWIIYAIAALVGVYLLLRFLANFTGWAKGILDAFKAFWEGLFRRKKAESRAVEETEEEVSEQPPPQPFADFHNPFLYGGERRPLEELVRYSFEALEAWAFEQGMGRKPDETPIEFVERLGDNVPTLETDVVRLGNMFAQVTYARARLPASCFGELKQFWQQLSSTSTPVVAQT